MRTTIPKTGNQSAHGSYGPRSHPPQVTGSRQNQPTVVKLGKRIGSWTSNECNSWWNGYLPSRPGASLAAAKLTMSLTTSSTQPTGPGCREHYCCLRQERIIEAR